MMIHLTRRALRTLCALLTALVFTLTAVLVSAQPGDQGSAQAIGATGRGEAGAVVAAQGTIVKAVYSDKPPVMTKEQAQEFEAHTAESNRSGPIQPALTAPFEANRGPETMLPAHTVMATSSADAAPTGDVSIAAAGDFTIFRNSVIPQSAIAGGYSYASNTQEPSTGVNGKNIFQTGNWYASRSFNNGAGWSYLNPFSIFGSGFCCDQVTLYVPSRNRQFWLLQYGNNLKLANTSGTDLFTNWCYYTITPSWFGQPSTTRLDYNDLAVSNNYIYITTNLFGTSSTASGILRIPIDPMLTCSGFGTSYITRTDSFTFKPVQGATDVIYWGSNWGQTNGSSFRIYSWAENSGTYYWYDRAISAFNFMYRNSGQNCGSANGVVKNWCQWNDSRVLSGYVAKGVLGFSFDAKQGSGYPFPYSRRVYFRESDKVYLGASSLWGSWGAHQYLSLTPSARGGIGGSFAWGGGTGTTSYYPGSAVLIDDDFAPNQPWSISFYLWGQGNTCQSRDSGSGLYLYRWGDYLTVRPFYPSAYTWVATGYSIKGAHCGATGWYAEPHNVLFGRARDAQSVYRWWNS